MARREKEEPSSPGVVVLFTSLMILLLAFFILLNSISTVEEAKVEAALKSLTSTFSISMGTSGPISTGPGVGAGQIPMPMNTVDQDYQSLRGLAKKSGLSGEVQFTRSGSRRTVVLPDHLLFETGSYQLKPAAQNFLKEMAGVIAQNQYPISLNGHTDNAPPPAGEDNWGLSGRRALAVARYLAGHGVNASRLAAYGLAQYDPRVPETSPQHRRLNNRVEIVFDARDASHYLVPEYKRKQILDFRGFVFDLLGEDKVEQGKE
ncbi:MAG: flagellar motor protein MotB [Desulfarculaceae bacterium]|jgi:chemotaxis protein MotB